MSFLTKLSCLRPLLNQINWVKLESISIDQQNQHIHWIMWLGGQCQMNGIFGRWNISPKQLYILFNFEDGINPLRPTAIQKLLEIIGRVRLYPSYSFATALDSDINQTTGSGGHLSMWENRCMHAAVCLLRAGQPRSAGNASKLGQFIGQFAWVTGDPIGLKGLMKTRLSEKMWKITYFEKLFRPKTYVVFTITSLVWPLSKQPAGTTRIWPSGLNAKRRKNDFIVSSWKIRTDFGFSPAIPGTDIFFISHIKFLFAIWYTPTTSTKKKCQDNNIFI